MKVWLVTHPTRRKRRYWGYLTRDKDYCGWVLYPNACRYARKRDAAYTASNTGGVVSWVEVPAR